MRGRTNIDGGGLEINGTTENYIVKTGSSILEGDFVQLDDEVIPETQETVVSGQFYSFTLSDGKQITFYREIEGNHAIIEEFSASGLVSSVNKSVSMEGYVYTLQDFVKVAENTFLAFGVEKLSYRYNNVTYAYYKHYPYVVVYDPVADTVTATKKNAVLPYTWSPYTSSNPRLFAVKHSSSNSYLSDVVVIACSGLEGTSTSTYTDQAKLTFVLYDYVQDAIIDTIVDSSTTTRFNSDAEDAPRGEDRSAIVGQAGNKFVVCFKNNSSTYRCRGVYFDDTSLTLISSYLPSGVAVPIALPGGDLLLCTPAGTTAVIFNTDDFTQIKQVTLPFIVQRSAVINDRLYVVRTNVTTQPSNVCRVTYDWVTHEISFSGVTQACCYLWDTRTFELSQRMNTTLFSTRGNITSSSYKLIISKEDYESGLILPTTETVRKIKEYTTRIDGVASESGDGGDLIAVFIPASS